MALSSLPPPRPSRPIQALRLFTLSQLFPQPPPSLLFHPLPRSSHLEVLLQSFRVWIFYLQLLLSSAQLLLSSSVQLLLSSSVQLLLSSVQLLLFYVHLGFPPKPSSLVLFEIVGLSFYLFGARTLFC